MNQRWLRIAGFGLVGVIVVGAFGVGLMAVLGGETWLWRNRWNASMGAWGVLTTFGAVILLTATWLGLRAWRWWRERS